MPTRLATLFFWNNGVITPVSIVMYLLDFHVMDQDSDVITPEYKYTMFFVITYTKKVMLVPPVT